MSEERPAPGLDFIRTRISKDKESGKNEGKVVTRFPPEPNAYLHVGHAKAICLSFGVAEEFGGTCHLRLDDTNPCKEEAEFVEAIKTDIAWLGFDWGDHLYFASDYFDQLYEFAIKLIKDGKAYVCDLNAEQMREYRGTLTEPGKNSPHRDRSVEENLDLFHKMRAGDFEEGRCVLRAKVDMGSPNVNMRDPVMYRILFAHHHRTGDKWCIYPTYDFTHGQSDSIEGVTHSLCTLEFEDHRPLYNWYVEQLGIHHPEQIEFARLNITYTVLSKRRLTEFVAEDFVHGWDDPRMPTLSGLRRRGFTPECIREFCKRIGISKAASVNEIQQLEHCLREDLNKRALRVMGVLDPIKVVITNYPEGQVEDMDAINNPEDESAGTRKVSFTRELYIERDDFMEDPPRKFFRLAPGREVRLRYAYFITCDKAIKNDAGEIIELHCTYDPETRGGNAPDGRRVKATMHWVSAEKAVSTEVRLYENLFLTENPDEGGDWRKNINPDSLTVLPGCYVEPAITAAKPGDILQFERKGYFCMDPDSTPEKPVFNRAVSLRDSWARMQKSKK